MKLFILTEYISELDNTYYYTGCGGSTQDPLKAACWLREGTAEEVCKAVNREFGDAYVVGTMGFVGTP